MNFKMKLLASHCTPLVVFAIVSLMLGLTQFRSTVYDEKEGNLRAVALAALTMYSSQGYGDYNQMEDGNVWRGMNFNVSQKASIVDDLKKQTAMDITFYFGDKAVMTSIASNEERVLGMAADSHIVKYVLEEGKQLWCRRIVVNGEECQAYVIPIRQESDSSVVGALMASQSSGGFKRIITQYVSTTLAVMLIILIVVLIFIRRHVDWFVQKFSEVTDKSRQDLLTGLVNKLTFESDTLEQMAINRKSKLVSVLFIIDFDNFKHVNDNYGHQTGDKVLKEFAGILTRTFRAYDVIGRVGGDEFMVFMAEMTEDNLGRADIISQDILQELKVLKVDDAGPFSCSIGIGTDDTGKSFKELYQLADKALYEAKARGKACYVRYSSADANLR